MRKSNSLELTHSLFKVNDELEFFIKVDEDQFSVYRRKTSKYNPPSYGHFTALGNALKQIVKLLTLENALKEGNELMSVTDYLQKVESLTQTLIDEVKV